MCFFGFLLKRHYCAGILKCGWIEGRNILWRKRNDNFPICLALGSVEAESTAAAPQTLWLLTRELHVAAGECVARSLLPQSGGCTGNRGRGRFLVGRVVLCHPPPPAFRGLLFRPATLLSSTHPKTPAEPQECGNQACGCPLYLCGDTHRHRMAICNVQHTSIEMCVRTRRCVYLRGVRVRVNARDGGAYAKKPAQELGARGGMIIAGLRLPPRSGV